jgi:hypothetical protein
MKRLLSILLLLSVVFIFDILPSYAGSIFYHIPLWQNASSTSADRKTIISITNFSDNTATTGTNLNLSAGSTGATVTIKLYNNVLGSGVSNWGNQTVGPGNLWASVSRTFSTAWTTMNQNFVADTSAFGGSGAQWTSSTGWAASPGAFGDLGYGIIEISKTGATPIRSDFNIQAWIYSATSTTSVGGFPIVVSYIGDSDDSAANYNDGTVAAASAPNLY